MKWLWLCLLGVGCSGGGSDGDTTDPTGPTTGGSGTSTGGACATPLVTLGEGEFSYEPRSDGDPVTLVRGPQGGWHVDFAGQVSGFGNLVSLLPSVVHPELGSLSGQGQEYDPYMLLVGYDEDTCSGVFFKARAFFDDIVYSGDYLRVICPLQNEIAEACLEVTDVETGVTATDCFQAVLRHDDWTVDACESSP